MLTEDYESFTESETKTLENYVTNTRSHVFVLRNLPEVIKGALFSRYSRSSLGLRTLLLKEFISNTEESAFAAISGEPAKGEDQTLAIQRAQNFYDRILDGYGDDSIGELGGAHLAVENVSMIAAKVIEDCRIGGSPLEKSTRYIYFDQKVNGEYLFYREPVLMTSAFRESYIETCNTLFETYSRLIPPLTEQFENSFPHDPATPSGAYKASIRAKVLDCLRGLLPASTMTNMGVYGNGRFFDQMIHKLHCSNLAELNDIGLRAHQELHKVIPSFVRRADLNHHTHESFAEHHNAMEEEITLITAQNMHFSDREMEQGVRLLDFDRHAVIKVAAALLFTHADKSLSDLTAYCEELNDEEIARILDAACNSRQNRRHKSPRALEHAYFTFEIVADYGIYRDLQRHRMLTQDRQLLSCDYDYFIPEELIGTKFEADYRHALEHAKHTYDLMSQELPEEAQYVVPMAYNIRWVFHANLRALQWLCELRSSPAGHVGYRKVAQAIASEVIKKFPEFERFFRFVDYDGHDLGRLGQEQQNAEKQLHHV